MLPGFVVAMDLTVLHLTVPSLTADLNPSPAELLWIVDIYGFLLSGSLITMGTLGDRIGRGFAVLTQARAGGLPVVVGGSVLIALGAGPIATLANAARCGRCARGAFGDGYLAFAVISAVLMLAAATLLTAVNSWLRSGGGLVGPVG